MSEIETALERARDTKALEFGVGAMEKVPAMFNKLFPGKTAIVVADKNTYAVAGEAVYGYLKNAGINTESPFIFTDPELFAEWSYIGQLEAFLKERDVIAVAVGSGVINDLTKLVSSHLGRRYMIVGTAASMDGYTAYGASITFEGNKQTFDCPAPLGMVLDPTVAAKAPEGMSASGYGDLMAKIPAGADWIIADAVGSESIDPFAFSLVQSKLRDALSDPDAVAAGDVEATGKLADGLIMSGFAMQAMSSSVRLQAPTTSSATIGIWKDSVITASTCHMVSRSLSELSFLQHVWNTLSARTLRQWTSTRQWLSGRSGKRWRRLFMRYSTASRVTWQEVSWRARASIPTAKVSANSLKQ